MGATVDTLFISGESKIPSSIISEEIKNKFEFNEDFYRIKGYYDIYEKGIDFVPDASKNDYIPSLLNYKKAANLINKEARFMFSKTPEVKVKSKIAVDASNKETINYEMTVMQNLINDVIDKNAFGDNIVKAARDCFIGERIGLVLNFSPETGITLTFLPALNFVFEIDENNFNILKSFTAFVINSFADSRDNVRIFKKKYYMNNGKCYIDETVYDGTGNIIEETQTIETLFTYIPAAIIRNDGLLGDMFGKSEVELLKDYEQLYSKIANSDVDAERQSMNPIRYTIDASEQSTKNLSISPGSYWDIQSDMTSSENKTASVGVLETAMNYSSALESTLNRTNKIMYDTLDMPDIWLESMTGVITSGKALKSIYWPLIVRCDEKMKAWAPALRFIFRTVIEGAKLYPEAAACHIKEAIPLNEQYDITVENVYPLQEEETEEKTMDIMEVNAQLMSKKAYMIKWRHLTSEEADEELKQIALERQILEDAFQMPPVDMNIDESI